MLLVLGLRGLLQGVSVKRMRGDAIGEALSYLPPALNWDHRRPVSALWCRPLCSTVEAAAGEINMAARVSSRRGMHATAKACHNARHSQDPCREWVSSTAGALWSPQLPEAPQAPFTLLSGQG